MDREYPFLFCSKSGFWLEYQMMRQNIFEKQKRQTPKMTFVYILRAVWLFLVIRFSTQIFYLRLVQSRHQLGLR